MSSAHNEAHIRAHDGEHDDARNNAHNVARNAADALIPDPMLITYPEPVCAHNGAHNATHSDAHKDAHNAAQTVILALPSAQSSTQTQKPRKPRSVYGPIRKNSVPKDRSYIWAVSDSRSSRSRTVGTYSLSGRSASYSDPTEHASGSEHDYNYDPPDYGHGENSSREGADDWDPEEQIAKEERWADRMAMKEKLAEEKRRIEMEKEFDDLVILSFPYKRDDPGSYVLPMVVDGIQFLDCLVDTGAACNVMSDVTYRRISWEQLLPFYGNLSFGVFPIKALGTFTITATVEGYPIPTEFVVVDTSDTPRTYERIILGRPFLATTGARIDFLHRDMTLRLPNVTLHFDPKGTLTKRDAHNKNARWERGEQRHNLNFRSSLGGSRGRGRGRGH